jgi:hypothetical protein
VGGGRAINRFTNSAEMRRNSDFERFVLYDRLPFIKLPTDESPRRLRSRTGFAGDADGLR